MKRLEKLLRQWAELQPEWCSRSRSGTYYLVNPFDPDFDYLLRFAPGLEVEDLAVLQAVLQKAIASHKGWSFKLEMLLDLNDNPQYSADVWRKCDLESFEGDICNEGAIALLTAYLAALRANVTARNAA